MKEERRENGQQFLQDLDEVNHYFWKFNMMILN